MREDALALRRQFARQLVLAIDEGKICSKRQLNDAKIRLCGQLGLTEMPPNPTILTLVDNPSTKSKRLLGIKPVRTLSGVAPVAIMTEPRDCLHGTCIFCPGGEKSVFGAVPKSYTGHEPASMRAASNFFDGYLQTINRLYQLAATNHSFQKVELIVMGGTFPSFSLEYQRSFMASAFKALNDFSELFFVEQQFDFERFNAFFREGRAEYKREFLWFRQQLLERKGIPVLEVEQKKNESAAVRLVACCIETKPDFCKPSHIDSLLQLGATRIELGIQALDDKILSFANRGHSVQDSVLATRWLKDSALKVTYHMMPGLPLSSHENDIEMFRILFENPDFRPDALKIYPCMVLPGTPLFKLFEQGKFVPLSSEEAAEIIAEAKRFFPRWVRVQRVMRDIPTTLSVGGVRHNNLRQLVEDKQREKGVACSCIRCREAGLLARRVSIPLDAHQAVIHRVEYEASQGTEVFLSADDSKVDALYGFCRLRIPFEPFRPEIGSDSALVRELHVVGASRGLGEKTETGVQHRGLGHRLLEEAETLAREVFDKKRLLVISGIGAREYYRKWGYYQKGVFMEKTL